MEKTGLSLVIPARNTEGFIKNSLEKYYFIFSQYFENLEILPVFNDSWDKGAEISRTFAQENNLPVKVIEIPQRGKGYALMRGFREAQYDLMGFMDADNPFEFEKIFMMMRAVQTTEADIAIATKYLKGQARIQESLMRRLISLGGGFVSRILFNLRFADTQAGAKFFTREVWQKIGKKISCHGFDFDIEFLYRAQKAGFKIREIYTPYKPEKFSTFRLKYLPGMLKRLLILRFLK